MDEEVELFAREVAEDGAKIRGNALLAEIYRDVYGRLLAEVPRERYPRLLEIGSGGGFFKELAPWAVTSEHRPLPGVERVLDACRLADEMPGASLDALVAFDVFHHLPDPAGFLRSLARVLRPGGRAALVEPWATPVGQWFHRALHHEAWVNDPSYWGIAGSGRSAANGRLPTSVFRDGRERLAREAPEIAVVKVEPFHKWLYLLSGGLRLNTRVPAPLARRLVAWDRRVTAGNRLLGLFALVVLERRAESAC